MGFRDNLKWLNKPQDNDKINVLTVRYRGNQCLKQKL